MTTATTNKVNERALRNEVEWLPSTLEHVLAIRRALLAANISPSQTDGITSWLIAKAAGEKDRTGEATRTRYRKVLASLESPLGSKSAIPGYLTGGIAA